MDQSYQSSISSTTAVSGQGATGGPTELPSEQVEEKTSHKPWPQPPDVSSEAKRLTTQALQQTYVPFSFLFFYGPNQHKSNFIVCTRQSQTEIFLLLTYEHNISLSKYIYTHIQTCRHAYPYMIFNKRTPTLSCTYP